MSTMTLTMPSNYVEIEREEMEYVDGGSWFPFGAAFPKWVVASATNVLISSVAGGVTSVGMFIKQVGVEEAKKIFAKNVAKSTVLSAIGSVLGGTVVSKIVDFALDALDPGSAFADWLDSIDTYPGNGYIG